MSEKNNDKWTEIDEEISLESILAEYKGEAFIEGQKKTPKEVLDQEAERILEETARQVLGDRRPKRRPPAQAEKSPRPPERAGQAPPQPAPAPQPDPQPEKVKAAEAPKKAEGEPRAEPQFGLSGHDTWVAPPPEPPGDDRPPRQPASTRAPAGETEPEGEPVSRSRSEPEGEKPGPVKLEPGKVIQIPLSRFNREEAASPLEETRRLNPEPPEPDEAPKKPKRLRRPRSVEETQVFEPVDTGFSDSEKRPGEYSTYADRESVEAYSDLAREAEQAAGEDEEEPGLLGNLLKRFVRRDGGAEDGENGVEEPSPAVYDEPEGEYDEEDLQTDGMTLQEAAARYGKGLNSYHMRGVISIALSLVMLLITMLFEGGRSLPGVLSTVQGTATVLLLLQLIVMFCGVEVIAAGVTDAIRLRLGVETLITVACLLSALDAVDVIRSGDAARGLPYGPVAAFSVGCALVGLRLTRNATKITLRTAATGANPYVVTSKYGALEEGYVLFKAKRETEGFLRKTQQMDFGEYIYTMAAPLLLVMAAVFALLSSVGGEGEIGHFLHNFSAMTAVLGSFTGLLAYGLPFSRLAKKLMKSGAALAGWGGAAEADAAAGVVVTDSDVFPAGTLSLSGVRVFRKTDTQRIISYTGSIVAATGCGLTDVFTDIIRQQKYAFYPVEDLVCYEGGGVGAKVNGEEMIVGSASFMNLMGVRLPQNLNVKNAVFSAMGGELTGVFAINYVPINSVQEALVSLLHTKIQPLFAVRDFNVTPMMLQNKFKISTDKMEFLSYEDRYALSAMVPDERARPFAVLCREGLGPLTDVVVGGKRLRWAVTRNVLMSLASSVLALLLLLSFFWAGSPEAASVANVFVYMAAWLAVTVLLSRSVTHD